MLQTKKSVCIANSHVDPYSFESVDPDPDSDPEVLILIRIQRYGSGFGSRGIKSLIKRREKQS